MSEVRRDGYSYPDTYVESVEWQRDNAYARAEKAERERNDAVRLLGVFYDDRYGGYSDCEEDDCEWCMVRRETWPLVKDRTAESMRPTPCPHEARAEKLAAALREIQSDSLGKVSRDYLRSIATRALAENGGEK